MSTSIVVPIFQKVGVLRSFLRSLEQTVHSGTQVILVNDGSGDAVERCLTASVSILESLGCMAKVLTHETPAGCGHALNEGLQYATGDIVIFADSDLVLLPGWQALLERNVYLKSPSTCQHAGMSGAVLLYPGSGSVQHAGIRFTSSLMRHWRLNANPLELSQENVEVQAAAFALFAMKREVLEAVGGLDETFLNGYEDFDFQMRARKAGFRTMIAPQAAAYHRELRNGPGRAANRKANLAEFWRRWGSAVIDDLTPAVTDAVESALRELGARHVLDVSESHIISRGVHKELVAREVEVFWMDRSLAVSDDDAIALDLLLPEDPAPHAEPLVILVENFVRVIENELWFSSRRAAGISDVVVDLYGNVISTTALSGITWPGRKVR